MRRRRKQSSNILPNTYRKPITIGCSRMNISSLINEAFQKVNPKLDIKDVSIYPEYEYTIKTPDVLVISGGGNKGVLVNGLIEGLSSQLDLSTTRTFIGTSIGSALAMLYAIRLKPRYIYDTLRSQDLGFSNIQMHSASRMCGFISPDKFFRVLEYMIVKQIGHIPTFLELYKLYGVSFECTGYNITKNRGEYFNRITTPHMLILDACKISCNIPLMFQKILYNGCYYIDGAFFDNFPIHYARKRYRGSIFAININDYKENYSETNPLTLSGLLSYMIFLPIAADSVTNQYIHLPDTQMIRLTIEDYTPLQLDMTPLQSIDSHEKGMILGKGIINRKKTPIPFQLKKEKTE